MSAIAETEHGGIERFHKGDHVNISHHLLGDAAFYQGAPMCPSTTGVVDKVYGSGTVANAVCTARDCGYSETVRTFTPETPAVPPQDTG